LGVDGQNAVEIGLLVLHLGVFDLHLGKNGCRRLGRNKEVDLFDLVDDLGLVLNVLGIEGVGGSDLAEGRLVAEGLACRAEGGGGWQMNDWLGEVGDGTALVLGRRLGCYVLVGGEEEGEILGRGVRAEVGTDDDIEVLCELSDETTG